MTRRATGRAQSLAYWLIARNEHGRIEVLTLDCKQTLPVFSNEDEAEMFLRLEGVADGWQVSESRAGELVSMLYGPCTSVKEVALDPLPEMVADRTVGLVSWIGNASFGACWPVGDSASRIEDRRHARSSTGVRRILSDTAQGVLHNGHQFGNCFPRRSQRCQATYS